MTEESLKFPLERLAEISEQENNFRLLERIPFTSINLRWPFNLSKPLGDELPMVLLDTETTGISADNESIIEIGMIKVTYSPSAQRIVSIMDVISLYEYPGKPIPEFITKLTGITDKMECGNRIDDTLVNSWLSDDPLVIAHNAKFDRPFFEKRFMALNHLRWGCSSSGIDWISLGFESRKLEYLLLRLGWFYEGHRAVADALAIAWLLYLLPDTVSSLLSGINHRTIIVRAFGAPFKVKDYLREQGYRWNNGIGMNCNKHWYREIGEDGLLEEKNFLNDLYHNGSKQAHYDYVDARNRFKALF